MRTTYQIGADSRHDQGKGASRRLRRAGKVPAVIYGGKDQPQNVTLDHQQLLTVIDKEKFYSSIINLNLDSKPLPAIVRDVQMHPAKNAVVHVDFQRVEENEVLKIHLPIHFKGEAVSPGVKLQGGIVSHLIQDIEVNCLPKDLPDFLELDLSAMNLNDSKHVGDIPLPSGVTIPELAHRNRPVVSVHSPRVAEPEPEAAAAAEGAAAGPAAGAAAAAAPAAGAAKAEPAKADAKKDAKK
ncbi:MAG TPA: 50S ribosomal protein L25/general stress protein Ctc [Steroidobacteraceae bacterium]|jgi:large subunit ribosomal protein L25|nr:50S ribosomal protein L25/general stress protein Ctc [Steroidobacteraceae bacterium]